MKALESNYIFPPTVFLAPQFSAGYLRNNAPVSAPIELAAFIIAHIQETISGEGLWW